MSDCSASVGNIPALTQVIVPVQQYSDKEEYGNDNPIFDRSVIAQIHLTMPPEFLTYQQEPGNSDTEEYLVSGGS